MSRNGTSFPACQATGFPVLLASLGVLIGAGAGLVTALSDFGAQWLWLPLWGDRGCLFFRLVGIQAPLGALAGGLLGTAAGAALAWWHSRESKRGDEAREEEPGRIHRALSVFFTALLAPAAIQVTLLLYTGGKMSRLDGRRLYEAATALVLLGGLWLALYLALRLFDRARKGSPKSSLLLAAGLLALALLLGKVDQLALPGLYGYLHAVLSFGSWALTLFALSILTARSGWVARQQRRLPWVAAVASAALCGLLAFQVANLDANQNVRVALLSSRAGHSRTLMLWLQPLLPRTPKRRKAPAAAAARKTRRPPAASTAGASLPALRDAHALLITIDALRADHLGLYGYLKPTSPFLDRLADESVVFERAYCQSPHSSFSISSLMTSEYLHDSVDLGRSLPEQTLADALNRAGFHTAAFFTLGIFYTDAEHMKGYADNGYRFALRNHSNAKADKLTDLALAEIDRTVARGEPNSLFWVHYFDVHEPYLDTFFGTSDMDRYDSEIRKTDREVERLITEARRRLDSNLIIAVSADHGEAFREHGNVYHGSALYEEQVRVPLILHVPGLAARRVIAPVELNDLAPTLLALLDVPVPDSMRGSDLRALAAGQTEERGPVFSSVMRRHMVVSWPYKLIADLRLGIFELFDLSLDPRERNNLADEEPDRLESLQGEMYAWLDDLAAVRTDEEDAIETAINRSRLGDKRALGLLGTVAADKDARTDLRIEAIRVMGRLADTRSSETLRKTMNDEDPGLAAEAAIALGFLYDSRARIPLQRLVASEDPSLRVRAALALGRLRDPEAVPGLIDALWIAPNSRDREDAVRLLGRIGDNRAVDPLVSLLPEPRTRYLVLIALGQIGDRRVFGPLADALSWRNHTIVTDSAIRGLGLLGDSRAVDLILPMMSRQPELTNCGESLVRLGAVKSLAVGGADVAQNSPGLRGFKSCYAGPERSDSQFLHRTWCETDRNWAGLRLALPPSVANCANGAMAILSARRTDAAQPVLLSISIGDTELEPVVVDGKWAEFRWPLDTSKLPGNKVTARVRGGDRKARFAIDHLLLVPRAAEPEKATGG